MKWLFAFLWFCCGSALVAGIARVQTTGGAAFEGEITIDPKLGLVITAADATSTNVPLSSIASAQFNLSADKQTNGTEMVRGAMPIGWTNQDVGRATIAGKARFENGAFTLSSSGTRIWAPEADEFHFACRRFSGDGQLVAQITRMDAGMAGIMFRSTLEPNSQFVMLAANAGPEGLIFRSRRDPANRQLVHMQGEWTNREDIKPPCWVKLIRKDKHVIAFKSEDDGITWQPIYDSITEWDRQVFAGVFVMGGDTNALKHATFANVMVEDEVDYRAKATNAPSKLRVFLNDGSVLAADSVSADQTKMRIGFVNTNYSASVFAVARVIFRPVPDRLKQELVRARKGVLLNTGDFFEGELRLIDNEQVKVASVLFGPRTFSVDRVLAITLSDSIELPAKYIVRTLDGSTIRAKSIAGGNDSLLAEELKLGALEIPLAHLSELKRGSGGDYGSTR